MDWGRCTKTGGGVGRGGGQNWESQQEEGEGRGWAGGTSASLRASLGPGEAAVYLRQISFPAQPGSPASIITALEAAPGRPPTAPPRARHPPRLCPGDLCRTFPGGPGPAFSCGLWLSWYILARASWVLLIQSPRSSVVSAPQGSVALPRASRQPSWVLGFWKSAHFPSPGLSEPQVCPLPALSAPALSFRAEAGGVALSGAALAPAARRRGTLPCLWLSWWPRSWPPSKIARGPSPPDAAQGPGAHWLSLPPLPPVVSPNCWALGSHRVAPGAGPPPPHHSHEDGPFSLSCLSHPHLPFP